MNQPTTALEPAKGSTLAVSSSQNFWSPEQLAALKQIGVANAPNADLAVFLNYAQRTGLDPFARQIYMIGRREKQGDTWGTKWTIQASIDGLRIVAERSGDYAGQVGPEYCGTDGVWRDVWVGELPPVAARVGVLRTGFAAPLYAVAYFEEYAQMRDGKPTSMWASKPKLMLAKCAEALALRKAFPNDLSGIYTADEMAATDNTHPQANAVTTWNKATPVYLEVQPKPAQIEEPQVVDVETGELIDEPTVHDAELVERAPLVGNITPPQTKAVYALLKKCGVETNAEQVALLARLTKNEDVASVAELSKNHASLVIEALKGIVDHNEDPATYLREWMAW